MFNESELPEGWYLLSKESATAMEKELHREICKGHVLYGLECFAIARREDRDDFLFSVKGATAPIYSVHLTWSEETSPEWPYAVPFESKQAFIHGWKRIFE
jgi:hypothetical protein